MLLEPMRRKRDKLAAHIRAGTSSKIELDAIRGLINDADFRSFQLTFYLQGQCSKCHQCIPAGEQRWQSKHHENLFDLCTELDALEKQAYHQAFA